MKKENNNLTIFLLGIIILLLATILILLVTNTITFNTNKPKEEQTIEEQTEEKQEIEEKDTYKITYEKEEYTTKRSDGTESSKNTRNLPRIINPKNQSVADKIVKYLTDVSNKEWENNIKKMADEVKELPYDDLGVTYLYETGITTANRLTFILTMNGGFGGVGWLSEEGYNFDAKTGDILTTDTIAINKDELKKYMLRKTNEKIAELKKVENNCIRDDYQNNLEEEINRNGNWYFTQTEIKIKLQKYSIACGAGGITEINLPKEEVNQYLKEEYKID